MTKGRSPQRDALAARDAHRSHDDLQRAIRAAEQAQAKITAATDGLRDEIRRGHEVMKDLRTLQREIIEQIEQGVFDLVKAEIKPQMHHLCRTINAEIDRAAGEINTRFDYIAKQLLDKSGVDELFAALKSIQDGKVKVRVPPVYAGFSMDGEAVDVNAGVEFTSGRNPDLKTTAGGAVQIDASAWSERTREGLL